MSTSLHLFSSDYDPSSYRIIHTPSAAAVRCLYYVQEIGYLKTLRPLNTDRKNLESYLFVTVCTGKGELRYGERTWTLNAGDCFLIDCRRPHAYKSSAAHPWSLMWVHFNGQSAAYYADQFRDRHDGAPVARHTPEDAQTALHELMEHYRSAKNDPELVGSMLLTRLLTALLLDYSPQTGALSEKLTQVYAYLEMHFAEPLTLDQLSAEFYISKYYLTRTFRQKYGDSIFAVILRLRINRAKELLRFTDASISEIAARCGFNDSSYFNRQFQRADHCTATEYRRRWKN